MKSDSKSIKEKSLPRIKCHIKDMALSPRELYSPLVQCTELNLNIKKMRVYLLQFINPVTVQLPTELGHQGVERLHKLRSGVIAQLPYLDMSQTVDENGGEVSHVGGKTYSQVEVLVMCVVVEQVPEVRV